MSDLAGDGYMFRSIRQQEEQKGRAVLQIRTVDGSGNV
jgi:hypothetical protein